METVPGLTVYNAKEALKYYEEMFDATIEDVYYIKDEPGQEESKYKDLVMHSRLKIGDIIFYLNDQLEDHIQEVGRNVQFCINVFTEKEFMELYNKLTKKSKLERDITVEYWNAKSFSIKDPYEIIWHIFYIMEVEK